MIINFSNIGSSGGGSGSGMTPSQVQTMIDNSITGKADTSAVTEVTEEVETKQTLYTATTLSAITSPKEGDVACIITTASSSTSSWENISVDGFGEVLDEERFWGRTFKFHYDLSENLYDEFQLFVELEDENNQHVFYGVDCVEDPEMADYMFEYYSGSTPSLWNVYGGQDITITFPEDDGTLTCVGINNMQFPVLNEVLTIQEYVETTTSSSTQYSYVNGQWAKTYKNVLISQSDYDALSGNTDENTIYNITGTTS